MKNDKTGSWEQGGPRSWERIPRRAIVWGESLGDLGMATSRKEQWAQQQRTQMKEGVWTGRALWIKWYQGGGTEWEKPLTDKCIPQRAGGHGDNLVFYSQCDGKPWGGGGCQQRSESKAHYSYCVEYRLQSRPIGLLLKQDRWEEMVPWTEVKSGQNPHTFWSSCCQDLLRDQMQIVWEWGKARLPPNFLAWTCKWTPVPFTGMRKTRADRVGGKISGVVTLSAW